MIARRPVLLGLLLAVALAPSAWAQPFVIEVRGAKTKPGGVLAIGDWRTEADPTLGAAIAAFGSPSSQRQIGGRAGCGVRWRSAGVRAIFDDLGGGVACNPADGRVHEARAYGSGRRTVRGLAVGDRVRRLRRLYPRAERHRAGFWLVTAFSLIGTEGRYPVLRSVMDGRRVRAFHIEVGAAGD